MMLISNSNGLKLNHFLCHSVAQPFLWIHQELTKNSVLTFFSCHCSNSSYIFIDPLRRVTSRDNCSDHFVPQWRPFDFLFNINILIPMHQMIFTLMSLKWYHDKLCSLIL